MAFCLPVINAASPLRLLGAWCAAIIAIAGDGVLVLKLDPGSAGVLDLVNLSLVILLMTGLLSRVGEWPAWPPGHSLSVSVGLAHAGRDTRRLRDLYLAADSSL